MEENSSDMSYAEANDTEDDEEIHSGNGTSDEDEMQGAEETERSTRQKNLSSEKKQSKSVKPDDERLRILMNRTRNKILRAKLYADLKKYKTKLQKKAKSKKALQTEATATATAAAERAAVPKTLETLRLPDETVVNKDDEEVMFTIENDELSSYFSHKEVSKVLITTSDKLPSRQVFRFAKELEAMIPNAEFMKRRCMSLKVMIEEMKKRNFTNLIVINERLKKPDSFYVSHLPEGPTLYFRIVRCKLAHELRTVDEFTSHNPELILNNFNTRIGATVARVLSTLFPQNPNYHGRRVITLHNQRDFIFVRHHRYVFRNEKKVGLKELGPRFTLKLQWVQNGTFDSLYGEYLWVLKRHQMETSRRKFFL